MGAVQPSAAWVFSIYFFVSTLQHMRSAYVFIFRVVVPGDVPTPKRMHTKLKDISYMREEFPLNILCLQRTMQHRQQTHTHLRSLAIHRFLLRTAHSNSNSKRSEKAMNSRKKKNLKKEKKIYGKKCSRAH